LFQRLIVRWLGVGRSHDNSQARQSYDQKECLSIFEAAICLYQQSYCKLSNDLRA
jgi:hypothetical protein